MEIWGNVYPSWLVRGPDPFQGLIRLFEVTHEGANVRDGYGRTPLTSLIQFAEEELSEDQWKKWLDYAEKLLKHGADINLADNMTQHTPLILAAGLEHNTPIQWLLENGANPGLADAEGLTPLMHASRMTRYENVQRLIDAGAPLDSEDRFGHTALFYALSPVPYGYASHEWTDTKRLTEETESACLEVLIKAGADISRRHSVTGATLLHYAAMRGLHNATFVLQKHGLEPADWSGVTPLLLAQLTADPEVIYRYE